MSQEEIQRFYALQEQQRINQGQVAPQQPQATAVPQCQPAPQEVAGRVLSKEQVAQAMEQLKVQTLTQPVKITQPSYLITEEQMRYLLGIAQSNPQQIQALQQQFNQQQCQQVQQQRPMIGQGGNAVDTLANATLGTVGRVGHTLTGLVDSVIEIFTLGYARR